MFNKKIIKSLQLNNIEFKILLKDDYLLEENIFIGLEGEYKVLRIAEDSPNPIDLFLTTEDNIKVYNKDGELILYVDQIYNDYNDLLRYLKEY